MRILGVIVIIWLVIGAIAAGQRHYYSKDAATSCASASTIVVTIVGRPAELPRDQPEGQVPASAAEQVAVRHVAVRYPRST